MQSDKVSLFLMQKQGYFPPERLPQIRQMLENMDEHKFQMIQSVDFMDPTAFVLISAVIGYLGIDRFLLGDIGLGILKFLTFGVCGILWIVDIVNAKKNITEKNFMEFLKYANL